MRVQKILQLFFLSFTLTACGGGGGGGGSKVSSKASSLPVSTSSSSIAVSSSFSSSSSSSVYSANVESLKSLATFPIGVAVSNTDSSSYNILTTASEKAVAEKHFGQMTAGNIMKVKSLHPNNNTGTIADYTFTNADAFVDYAKSKNMTVHGHTLIWHSDYQVPDFITNWSGTSADFLTMLEAHVTTIVDHFEAKGGVQSWDVVNEALNDDNNSSSTYRTESPFYVKSDNSPEFIERAFKAARLADANVDLYYNDYSIENNEAKTDKLIVMIDDLQTKSTPITGIGFQMHVYMDYPSITNIKAAIQKVVDKNLKVKITELDVSVNNPFNNWPASKISTFTESVALAQKKRYCEIVKAYIDTVPVDQRGGITVWGTTDANSWLDDPQIGNFRVQFDGKRIAWPLLFDSQYNDKPALRGFADGLLGTACTNL